MYSLQKIKTQIPIDYDRIVTYCQKWKITEPDKTIIQLISLRKALLYERKLYELYLKDKLEES